MSNYQQLIRGLGQKRILQGEVLAKHTSFRIGGPADLYFQAKSNSELIKSVVLARKHYVPYFLLGGGSNILVSDDGFRGLVIHLNNDHYKLHKEKGIMEVFADAGMKLSALVDLARQENLSGIEFLVGIPGTVGGAVRGNAGAWQQAIGDRVKKVQYLNRENQLVWLEGKHCQFNYRQSLFKQNQDPIIQVKFVLKRGDRRRLTKVMNKYLDARSSQPKLSSAGCIFVNPPGRPAGSLIDKCNLKGKTRGKAQISPAHANFIVNLGGAKAGDVLYLIRLARKEVKKRFGLELKVEIDLVGFGD